MKITLLVVLLSTLLLMNACQPIQPPADAGAGQVQDTVWVLSELGGESVAAEITVTAMFGEDGRLAGSSGCNNYSTSYTVDGQSMTIDPMIMSTMMMCPEPIMEVETDYLAALPNVAGFEVSGDTLVLSDSDGVTLASFRAQSQELAGTAWDVISYNNGNQAVVSVIAGTELTATFDEEGTVAGSAGCNNYMGSYEVDGDQISIGPLASTRMMCPDEQVMEQEMQFLAAMESAATYSVEGSRLQFRTADGAMAVNLQAAE